MSRSSREKLVAAFKGVISAKDRSLLGQDPVAAMFQQSPITGTQMNKIFGSPEEFLERYSIFEQKYFSRLDTHLNLGKTNRMMAAFNKRKGVIDLSILTRDAQEELATSFKNDVMRIDSLMREAGLPSIELPSANLYRSAFQFRVDNSAGVQHPAQILLNRSIFNFNADKKGSASISINRRNMFGSKGLSDLFDQMSANKTMGNRPFFDLFGDLKEGARIVTFDTETTGIAENSQIRSISALNMFYRNGKYEVDAKPYLNLGFSSGQLNGITANMGGSTVSLNELLSRIEKTKFSDMGTGGTKFLDDASSFIDDLLTADRVAGHNINFDLNMLTKTMMAQPGFSNHARAGRALDALYNRKTSEANFIVDTLESTRMYIRNKAEEALAQMGNLDMESTSAKYIRTILSEPTMAKLHLGGSSAYADVGNIALNTNLFELIEKEPNAQNIFATIQQGSHIAETDVHLQSYIAKFVQTNALEIRTDVNKLERTAFGNFARNVIAKSHAITPTTDIADIAHMSETVYRHVRDGGLSNVVVRGEAAALGLDPSLHGQEGMVQFLKSKNAYVFSSSDGVTELDTPSTRKMIQDIVDQARSSELSGGSKVQIGNFGTITTNLANDKVLSYGLNYGTASTIDQLAAIGNVRTGTATADTLLQTLGTTYSELGTGLSTRDQIRGIFGRRPVDSVFQQGIANFDHQAAQRIANTFGSIGDAYAGVMGMQERVFSTSIANATAGIGRDASRAFRTAGGNPDAIAHSLNPQLTAELGFSYFKDQNAIRIWDGVAEDAMASSRPMMPLAFLQEAMGENFLDSPMQVGLSRAHIPPRAAGESSLLRYNAVWKAGEQIDEGQSKILAEALLDLSQDTKRASRVLGMSETDLISNGDLMNRLTASQFSLQKGRAQAIDTLAERIRTVGIGFGFADGREAQNIEQAVNALGLLGETDTDLRISATVAGGISNKDGNVHIFSPWIDREAALASGKEAELRAAETIGSDGISEGLGRVKSINEVLEAEKGLKSKLRLNLAGAKTGMGENAMLELYKANKSKVGLAAGIGLVAGIGYYMNKRHQKSELYDETMARQPTEPNRNYAAVSSYNASKNTFAGDPLSTAGIVGNLDRMKIGHGKMGNNKYDHLYGG